MNDSTSAPNVYRIPTAPTLLSGDPLLRFLKYGCECVLEWLPNDGKVIEGARSFK